MAKDYYKILGVEKGASQDDIKKAYRKLAHQHHPDKNGGNDAKFKEISEAYQILSNSEKRAQYDRFGQAFGEGGPQGGFGQGGFNFDASNFEDIGDMGDIFGAIFEGMGMKRRKTYTRGSDIELVQEITLEEAFKGAHKKFKIKTFVECADCKGIGHDPKDGVKSCEACDGQGKINEARSTIFGNFSQIRVCDKCAGQGQIPNKPCKKCSAKGRVKGEKEIAVDIVPGIADGQLIKITNAGEKGERGAGSGDLYIRMRVRPHKEFARIGDDLVIKKEFSLVDVLLGKKIKLHTISGRDITVEIPPKFNLKDKLIVSGEGMPRLGGYGKGNLLVELEIRTPKKINRKAQELLQDLEGELS